MYDNVKIISYDEAAPVGIRFVGESICDERFFVERNCSDITSLEYISEGEGILEIEGQVLYPKKGDIFFLRKGTRHKYYCNNKNGWRKYFISFYGPVTDVLIDVDTPYGLNPKSP